MRKAFDVTDLGDHRQGKLVLDLFVTGQGLNRFLVVWRFVKDVDLLIVLRQDGVLAFQLTQQQIQVHFETT